MAVTSGFFNSIDEDRTYDAEQMGQIFDGIINDGVYETYGEAFKVIPGEGSHVIVGTGRAWFDHTWTLNDTRISLAIEDSEVNLDRIDTVVIEVNHRDDVRSNSLKIIKGTPGTSPVSPDLEKSYYVKQYPLADIYVSAGASTYTQSSITNRVGTSDCPFVIGIIEIMTIDLIVSQWSAEFKEWMTANETEFRHWYDPFVTNIEGEVENWYTNYTSTSENRFSNWYTNYTSTSEDRFNDWYDDFTESNEKNFKDWFSNVQYVMDGDVAGHLQNEIDNIRALTNKEINNIWSSIFGGGE